MATKKFKTELGVQDGYLAAGNTTCSIEISNTATTMRCGCTGATRCLLDDVVPDCRSYGSFPTKWLKDKQVLSIKLYYYVASITKGKTWGWSVLYEPYYVEVVIAKDFIEEELQITNWAIGETDYETSVPSVAGWYSVNITEWYTDGDTDFCLRPNTNWNTNADSLSQNYYLNITTVEGGANQPYLEVKYREENLIKTARLKMRQYRR